MKRLRLETQEVVKERLWAQEVQMLKREVESEKLLAEKQKSEVKRLRAEKLEAERSREMKLEKEKQEAKKMALELTERPKTQQFQREKLDVNKPEKPQLPPRSNSEPSERVGTCCSLGQAFLSINVLNNLFFSRTVSTQS